MAGGLAASGLVALYLRSDKRVPLRGLRLPIFSFLLLVIGAALCIAAVVFWLLPDGPTEPRVPLSVFGPLVLIAAWLSWKYHEPVAKRTVRLGLPVRVRALAMTAGGLVQRFAPDPDAPVPPVPSPRPSRRARKRSPARPRRSALRSARPSGKSDWPKARPRTRRNCTLTQGSYLETVDLRARRFVGKAARDFGFSVILMGMFLLGVWFVRSGVMENTRAHLPLFRKLAVYGLPSASASAWRAA